MSELSVAFLGDIFGAPGRQVVQQQLPRLRLEYSPDVVIANAENARSGSGLSAEQYAKIRAFGIDAITLGDHCYRDPRIIPILEKPDEPILRPANLAEKAAGSRLVRLSIGQSRSLFIITVLGRVFFPLPADDPFATIDRMLDALPEPNPLVVVEAHMEATSEKAALAHHLDGRVAAVLGSHTHVQTADARILPRGTAFVTDLGMCGARNSIIGRDVQSVLTHMTSGMRVSFGIGQGQEVMCGAVVRIDRATGRARDIETVQYEADPTAPPFGSG